MIPKTMTGPGKIPDSVNEVRPSKPIGIESNALVSDSEKNSQTLWPSLQKTETHPDIQHAFSHHPVPSISELSFQIHGLLHHHSQ